MAGSCPPELTPYSKPPATIIPGLSPLSTDVPAAPQAHGHLNPFDMCGFDPLMTPTTAANPRMVTTHQLKGVPTFSGRDKNIRVEDWVRDMTYMLGAKGLTTDGIKFQEVVRNTSGRARDVILNLESRSPTGVTAEDAFKELLQEFGEDDLVTSPMTRFYSREQKSGETASEYAVALEALLRRIEERGRRQGYSSLFGDSRDILLTTQFMAGLRDGRTKQRLAPMQPRKMSFKDLRAELRVITEEQQHAEERRRQRMGGDEQPFYSMSEVTGPKSNAAPSPSDQKAPKKKASTSEPESKDVSSPDLQQLLTKQIEEMQAMRIEQWEALQLVRNEQRQMGHRLAQLEETVFRPAGQLQQLRPRPKFAQFSGCFNCGSKQHLARNCPEQQHPARQQNPHVTTPAQPASAPQQIPAPFPQSSSLNGQNLQM